MADEASITSEEIKAEEQEQPHGSIDWKAEARKWEQRSKENKAAADELAKIKRDQMSELEKAQADAALARAEADQLKAERDRSDAAIELSEKHDIPASMLMYCADRDAMEKFAEEWCAYHDAKPKVHVGTSTSSSRIVKPDAGVAKASAAQAIAEFFGNH